MLLMVPVGETDDPYFVALLDGVVSGLVRQGAPQGLWIVQIDNWFDDKWLKFSVGNIDLNELYQEKVTFPPFSPNRVTAQWAYARDGDHYVETPARVPHRFEKQPSEMNRQRRVQDFKSPSCFVWYSAKTVANGRGSLMVYNVTPNGVEFWYAAFIRSNVWKLHLTQGISRTEIEDLMRLKPSIGDPGAQESRI